MSGSTSPAISAGLLLQIERELAASAAGRAFLADYARRVRRRDTHQLLDAIARLHRRVPAAERIAGDPILDLPADAERVNGIAALLLSMAQDLRNASPAIERDGGDLAIRMLRLERACVAMAADLDGRTPI